MTGACDWGEALWDQYGKVSDHVQKGVDLLEKICQYFKERRTFELEYSAKMRKLSEKVTHKKRDETYQDFTSLKGFLDTVNAHDSACSQHEILASKMTESVIEPLVKLSKDTKDRRKQLVMEVAEFEADRKGHIERLEKAKKAYEKAYKEARKGYETWKRNDDDRNSTKAEVEKSLNIKRQKECICEQAKNDYAHKISALNDFQKKFHYELIVQVLRSMQALDMERTSQLREILKSASDCHRAILPIVNDCLGEAHNASQEINPETDCARLISLYQTGSERPVDMLMEDLGDPCEPQPFSQRTSLKGPNDVETKPKTSRVHTLRGRISRQGGKKHEEQVDFSNLPPVQRVKQLEKKLNKLTLSASKKEKELEALHRMVEVYEKDSSLGDAALLEVPIEEAKTDLAKTKAEVEKFQKNLDEAKTFLTPQSSRKATTLGIGSTSSVRSSLSLHKDMAPQPSVDGGSWDDDKRSLSDLPSPVGECVALYEFVAISDNNISMNEGDNLYVTEWDVNDGWTQVRRREAPHEQGYVPTSYLQINKTYST